MNSKKLNLFDFSIIMVSVVIGMGIFRTPINIARAVDTPFLFFFIWVAGGIVALCGALTFAEIGSRLPVTGGYYKVFSYAYHPSIAFAINCVIMVSNAAGVGGVGLVGGEYITGVLFPMSKDITWMADPAHQLFLQRIQVGIALSAIGLFYFINLLGLKMSARSQNVLMVIKIAMIVLLITPLFFADPAPVSTLITHHHIYFTEYLKAFGTGLVAVSFTYGGYEQTINFGAEVEQPRKFIPRGIFIGIIIILLLYLCINFAYIRVIGFDQLKTSTNIAAIMASKIFGVQAERILSVLLFLSVLAYVNVQLMSNPRVMAAMSEDKILPPAFSRRHPKTGALTTSLTVYALMSAIIVFWAEQFDYVLSFSIFLDSIGMVLAAGSIFVLRKRTKELDGRGIYTMRLYPLLPILFMAAYSFVTLSLLFTETRISLIGIAVMIVFISGFFIAGKLKKS
jgi:basic amino acid/polyamine antiporter, APA family